MKRRSSRAAGSSPDISSLHENAALRPARTASNVSAILVSGLENSANSMRPALTPVGIKDSAWAKPRKLGSAASVARKGWALMSCSAARATSEVERNNIPFCSKNGPASGWRTDWKCSGSFARACTSARDALSASSGVAASSTTTIVSACCGNAASNWISRCRQGNSAEMSWLVSVVIAKFPGRKPPLLRS